MKVGRNSADIPVIPFSSSPILPSSPSRGVVSRFREMLIRARRTLLLCYLAIQQASSVSASPLAAQITLSSPREVYAAGDGQLALDQKTQVGFSPNGSLFLSEAHGAGIFYLPKVGGRLIRIGRKGSGPGEYERILAFGWLNDTLWISDDGSKRLTFVAELGSGKSRTMPFIGGGSRFMFISPPSGLSPDGAAICSVLDASGGGSPDALRALPVLRTSRDGRQTSDTLFWLAVGNLIHKVQLGKGAFVGYQPMSDASVWAVSRNGRFVVSVSQSSGSNVLGGASASVTLMNTSGRVQYKVSAPAKPRGLSRREANDIINSKLAELNDQLKSRGLGEISKADYERGVFVPSVRTAVVDALVSDDGEVLLRGNDWNTATVSYWWLRADGTLRGSFTVPSTQIVKALSRQSLWSIMETKEGDLTLVVQNVQ